MDSLSFSDLIELGMDHEPFSHNHQWPANSNSSDEFSFESIASVFSEDFDHSDHQQIIESCKREAESSSQSGSIRPSKQMKNETSINNNNNNNNNNISKNNSSSSSQMSFNSLNSNFKTCPNFSFEDKHIVLKPRQAAKRISNGLSKDNILAERKRREKLNERFMALTAIIPHLKKLDKASILGEAINYMKELQYKLKILEDQSKKITHPTDVDGDHVQNSSADDNDSLCSVVHGRINIITALSFPEIEARICNEDVLITVHCEKRKGILETTLAQIEKLNLSVVKSSVMSYGDSALNISIVAKKDEECTMNKNELLKNLRVALEMFS